MLETIMQATKPNKIEFTVQITFKLEDWELLRDDLKKIGADTRYPTSSFCHNITSLVNQAHKIYYPEKQEQEDSSNGTS